MQENVTSSGSFDMEIEGGFISPLFATETTAVGDRIAVLREPLIVIHDEVLWDMWIIQSLAEHALEFPQGAPVHRRRRQGRRPAKPRIECESRRSLVCRR